MFGVAGGEEDPVAHDREVLRLAAIRADAQVFDHPGACGRAVAAPEFVAVRGVFGAEISDAVVDDLAAVSSATFCFPLE